MLRKAGRRKRIPTEVVVLKTVGFKSCITGNSGILGSGCHPCRWKETQNRIIGLICPFLPPRVFVKCPSIRKMDGRGGGDRNCIPSLLSLIGGRRYPPSSKPIVRKC